MESLLKNIVTGSLFILLQPVITVENGLYGYGWNHTNKSINKKSDLNLFVSLNFKTSGSRQTKTKIVSF